MGKGKKKNGKPTIWKNKVFLGFMGVVASAVIAGIFGIINILISPSKNGKPVPATHVETKGGKSPAIVADRGSRVAVTYHEA